LICIAMATMSKTCSGNVLTATAGNAEPPARRGRSFEGTSTVPCPFWLAWVPDTSENGTKPTITGSAARSPSPQATIGGATGGSVDQGVAARVSSRRRRQPRCRAAPRRADDRSGPIAAAVTALDPAPTCAAA
jgi:hypothetical protein